MQSVFIYFCTNNTPDTSTVVKVTFKNIKTKKTTTLKYRCVVKPAEIKEYQIVSAEATGVKTITVTMNKDVTLTDDVKITVAKGTADRACKATASGKVITLAMDAKLIAGDYTVTIKGLETKDLTATVNVAKDETLTSFKVSNVATMARNTDASVTTDSAIVAYEALNQYNERMSVSDPQVSCTLGSATIEKAATATAAGTIKITNIPAVMAIQGTKGTVILVDTTNGVNANQEVTVSAAATPATVEVAGVYNANSNKIEELQAGANLSSGNYYILFTSKDQYDNDFTDDKVFGAISTISIAGGLTNVALGTTGITTRTVDGKDYLAIPLTGSPSSKAVAGTYNLTMVNKEKGMLLNNSYTVADAVIVKSINITADKGLYANSGEQELNYEITDQNGNAVTSYSVLSSDLVRISAGTGKIKFVKNADGTAKLVWSGLEALSSKFVNNKDDKESTPVIATVYANEQTSSNFIVKPVTFTVYEGKMAKNVSKLKDGTATSLALGKKLEISIGDIVYVDQYGNEMSAKDAKLDTAGSVAGWDTTGSVDGVTTVYYTTTGLKVGFNDKFDKLVFDASNTKNTATATVYLKYSGRASASNYDCKFTVTATNTKGVDASTLTIKSINGGKAVEATGNATEGFEAKLTTDMIEVVGKIGGNDTVIPESQYVITATKDMKITADEYKKGTKEKTAEVTIQITTLDANGNNVETTKTATFKISTADAKRIAKVDGVASSYTGSTSVTSLSAIDLKGLFTYKDQFDAAIDSTASGADKVLLDVAQYDGPKDGFFPAGNGSAQANLQFDADADGTYIFTVKAYMMEGTTETSSKDCKIKVTVVSGTITSIEIL